MKKILAALLCIAAILSLLAGCGGSSTPAAPAADNGAQAPAAPADGEKNTAVTIGYVIAHNPAYPSSPNFDDFIQQGMIYDKLFDVDDVTGEYYSPLLESYEWTDDVTLHMVLKDGITFNDGKVMTMDDVLFSMQNYMRAETTDKVQYYAHIDFDASKVSEDGKVLDLVWKDAYGPALRTLNCAVMEKEFTEEHIEDTDEIWYTAPVGSGPYVVKECVKNSYVVYTLREDYWDTSRTFDADEITLKFYTDSSAMYMDYVAGNLDVIYDVGAEVISKIEADPGLGTVTLVPDNDVVYIHLNEDNEILSDPKVREAIAYALDMDYITEVCYGPLGTPATSHFASGFDAYTEHERYPYDPEKAAAILKEAGYGPGDISLRWISPEMPPEPQIGECVQALLEAVGISVSVETPEFATALGSHLQGITDISDSHTMGGNPAKEPDNSLSAFYEGGAFTSFSISEPDYNALYYAGLNTTDEAERWEAYKALDAWLWDNFMVLPVCEVNKAIVYNSRIAEFPASAIGRSCLGSLKLA